MSMSFEAEIKARLILVHLEEELDKIDPNLDEMFQYSISLYELLTTELVKQHDKVKQKGIRMMSGYFKEQRELGYE